MQAWQHVQSSSTNCPRAFLAPHSNESDESMLWAIPSVFAKQAKNNLIEKRKHSFHDGRRERNTLTLYDMQGINTLIKAIDSVGDPPLPIPNREVKPDSADGTAKICGRVGHRHFYLETLDESSGFLFSIISTCRGSLCNLLYCKH